VQLEFGPYLIKTAETQHELIESFKLRYEVFHQEFRNVDDVGLDLDKYDHSFDHLIIQHKESQKIIGTYRLSLIKKVAASYTAGEFDIRDLVGSKENFLELGRACIHKDFRKGAIVLLLWRGIAEYMNKSGATALFGCSSLKISRTRDAALVYKYLQEQNHTSEEFKASPKGSYIMRDFDIWYMYFGNSLTYYQVEEAAELVPSLLRSYLKLGAKIICEPAYDEEFFCVDLLTVLKKADLSNFLARKFSIE
jgi:putative hemolysin